MATPTPPSTPGPQRNAVVPGATVPLANNGMTPNDIMKLASTPPVTTPPPKVYTQAQYEGEVARKISQDAERARQAAVNKGQIYQKGNKEMERRAAEAKAHSDEHVANCARMTNYKMLYEKDSSVPWKWRRSYEPDAISPEDCETEKKGLELILDTRHAPSEVKNALPWLMKLIEELIEKAKIPNVSIEHAWEDMDYLCSTGALDDDIKELIAKYGWYFQMPVEMRIAKTFVMVALNRHRKNHPWNGTRTKANVSAEVKSVSSDL